MENRQRLRDDGRNPLQKVTEILEALEKMYGPQQAAGPTDPYEMIIYLNCGYPATDLSCSKGFDALKQEVGLSPKKILAASKTKLAKLLRLGGIVPEQRAARLQEIARKVKAEFGGELKAVLKNMDAERKKAAGQGHSRGEKSVTGIPRSGRAQRGENTSVIRLGAGGCCAVGVCRGARAAVVWKGREKLCRGLPRRARYPNRRAGGDLWGTAEGLPAAKKAWAADLQAVQSEM